MNKSLKEKQKQVEETGEIISLRMCSVDRCVFMKEDVQDAVNDFVFIESCVNARISGDEFDMSLLKDICNKYDIDINRILDEDYSTIELFELIFGDWERIED